MRWQTWGLAAAVAVTAVAPQLVMGQQRSGYLPAGTIDIVRILAPAPVEGEPRYQADRDIFKATRHWLGTPRGELATRDVATDAPAMTADFSCALDVTLTPENAPRTVALIAKAGIDTSTQSGAAKKAFKRLRPYQIDRGATCQSPDALKGSYDYPSGHTTWGWTWALILSDIAPDRAAALFARGRSYGESRIVCGVHNASAVGAGQVTALRTLRAVRRQPAFQADLAAARAEIAALRASPATPRPKNFTAEAALIARAIL